MSRDQSTIKVREFSWELILHSGGSKVFLWLLLIMGVIFCAFAFITKSLIPLYIFSFFLGALFVLFFIIVLNPKYWPFFLETHQLLSIIRSQMDYLGDSKAGTAKIADAKLVQPILVQNKDEILTNESIAVKLSPVEDKEQTK